ncbi:carboxypeptidase-like regulatory domain-containing protein [Halopiger djelfimassiliensis]|uniref:carboxypeptidase-like regulatory domain-containing protein n=1 Tax=Halopiger djelfimassiliensis TaxID=1293047 RepID=UPI0006775F54|nr:carboxypeptidase-like regulatory domain-containing protein [Halopiger djelfimassiliensis]
MIVSRQLVLELERSTVAVGDGIGVRVRDETNRPIENAVVEAGTKRTRTDESGRCRLTLNAPGFWKLIAVKEPTERTEYEPATALVRAVPGTTDSRRVRRIGFPRA